MTNVYRDEFVAPFGILEIMADESHLMKLDLLKSEHADRRINPNPITDRTKDQLRDYFEGKRMVFDLPILPQGTEYQKKVWQHLLNIPYGETISYKTLAIWTGNDKASRAVGHANSKNTIMIVIPCHRVIGKNGELTGYAGGLDVKRWLIEHEQKFANTKGL
ncbi:methylated-DNA--[protein]-cysteine S-methyltransferase [Fusibacter ferrireducens]|uniref:Methylated-DNA--protein-cysteine methyltransferase n=1 Tax=Fusibacter ferrireducens TaxID=2785058 RepID=A0ABR9ZSR4_9FIRM|nr:methylated-DNA--[protein]-cysteine S-methyltransferase [Fusibacter ferrireducens]MBF4693485.1 methylated-DNA--[protein]-cysteine S-methyltransferase [Fusibacter ferrireducens]